LIYAFDGESPPVEGARVKVPLGRGERVGFVAGAGFDFSEAAPSNVFEKLGNVKEIKAIKAIKEVLDETSVLGDELWNLAAWIGKTFLCGMGEALQIVCPNPVLQGEPLAPRPAPPAKSAKLAENGTFQEILFYHPLDEERFAYYRERLSSTEGRVLLLFPEAKESAAFFTRLPKTLKENALLWPSTGGKKLWDAWNKTASGEVRIVIGARGAVFAPFSFDEFIVDDESNPAYLSRRAPRLSARSLTGRRALFLKARLVLGGRMPSAKTFLRSRPRCQVLPNRKNLVFVDMRRSFKTEVRGIEGRIPITGSLVEHTRTTLSQGRHVFWIMDRKGQAGEVCCSDCGDTLYCSRCGSVMRTESENARSPGPRNTILRCVRCGSREALPVHCPTCRGTLLLGKRPGLEELLPLAKRYVKGRDILLDTKQKPSGPSLILGTRGLLSSCAALDVGLVAWLDLDAEARKVEYNARFQAFSMVWESCWRGLRRDEQNRERVVLIQTRRPGSGWQRSLWLGWEDFWEKELQERKHLSLPPYGLLIQVDLPENKGNDKGGNAEGNSKTDLIQSLEKADIFAMDAGDEKSSLWIAAKSTDRLAAALAPRFEIKHSRLGFPVATVWTE
jgi:primosomal protein N' (replication factor Y)